MRENFIYSLYYHNLIRLLVLGIIPFTLLAYFNYNIYSSIRLPPILRENSNVSKERCNQEKDQARVFIAIVVKFIVCHALRVFINFYETIVIKNAMACQKNGQGVHGFPPWIIITIDFSQVMIVLNCSFNMAIYCYLNTNFRKQILTCLCFTCGTTDNTETNSNIELQGQNTSVTHTTR